MNRSDKGAIQALVFDFDGLIIDTEAALIDAYEEVYRAHGVSFDRAEFIRSVGGPEYTFDPWHPFGRTTDRMALETERSRHNRERGRVLKVLPGVADLIASARKAGLRIGLASNSGHPHVEGHLERVGLLHQFDFLACREDVPSPKPEPDLYHLVINHFGLHGRDAVAFEDSSPGSLAAKRAGLWVVAVPNLVTAAHNFEHVHWRVPSIADVTLPKLLGRFGAVP